MQTYFIRTDRRASVSEGWYPHHKVSVTDLPPVISPPLRLATIHNLSFIHSLMGEIRSTILDGTFSAFRDNFLASYQPTDEQTRFSQKQKWLEARERGE